MRRKLFTLASVLSLILCAATVVLWVRSYQKAERLEFANCRTSVPSEEWFTSRLDIGCYRGVVGINSESIVWQETYPNYSQPPGDWRWHFVIWDWGPLTPGERPVFDHRPDPRFQKEDLIQRLGFGHWNEQAMTIWFDESSQFNPTREIGACVPLWAIVLGAALLPLCKSYRLLSHRTRSQSGLCTGCGYDLRASPGRCPECGTVPAGDRV